MTNFISCFIPVVNNIKDIKLNYFFNLEELPALYWFKEQNNFSILFQEYVKVECNIQNPQTLLNRIFISLNTNAKAKVIEVEIINDELILKLDYFFAEYFQKNETVVSLEVSLILPEITMKILERYFKKPEGLILSLVEKNEINILKNNDNFTVKEFIKNKFPHNNHIVKVKNNFTKKESIVFFQTSNQTEVKGT